MKSTNILIRISQEEKQQISKLAKEHYLTLSSYIRMKALTTKTN